MSLPAAFGLVIVYVFLLWLILSTGDDNRWKPS